MLSWLHYVLLIQPSRHVYESASKLKQQTNRPKQNKQKKKPHKICHFEQQNTPCCVPIDTVKHNVTDLEDSRAIFSQDLPAPDDASPD